MDLDLEMYLEHYIDPTGFLPFLGVTFVLLLVILLLMYLYVLIPAGKYTGREKRKYISSEFNSLTERFYELIFSGGSILFFMAAYYLINRFLVAEPFKTMWDRHSDMLLLAMIIVSILLNRLVDNLLIRLKVLSHEDKASIRLVGMLYMILIFCYIKFIYENDNYDAFISYFIGLMIGRFAYFDVSVKDLTESIRGAVKNIPLMLLALAYLAALSWFGFKTEYLVKHIGVITNVFFIHVFMTMAIFVVFHVYHIVWRKPEKSKKSKKEPEIKTEK